MSFVYVVKQLSKRGSRGLDLRIVLLRSFRIHPLEIGNSKFGTDLCRDDKMGNILRWDDKTDNRLQY